MTINKGIILAGGTGSRLFPLTKSLSKQLLPVYDKPMIYYPLSTLMLMGIQDILIVTTPEQKTNFEELLGNGSHIGINIQYKCQLKPEGLSHAILTAKTFIETDPVMIILGDNLFHGSNLIEQIVPKSNDGATIYLYSVKDPERYGILDISKDGNPLSIEEKPKNSKSNLAITGLYCFDKDVIKKIEKIEKSPRNEFEITDLIKIYMNENKLNLRVLSRGIAWFDTGTPSSLFEAGSYVRTLEERQGQKVSCPEEIAWRNGWIDDLKLRKIALLNYESDYSKYLINLIE